MQISITKFLITALFSFATLLLMSIIFPSKTSAIEYPVLVAPPCSFSYSMSEVNQNRAHWGSLWYDDNPSYSPRDGRAIDLTESIYGSLIGPVSSPATQTSKFMSCGGSSIAKASISGTIHEIFTDVEIDNEQCGDIKIVNTQTGLSAYYRHLNLKTVNLNSQVNTGDTIGSMSSKCPIRDTNNNITGYLAKHIHFEVKQDNNYLTYKSISGREPASGYDNQWEFASSDEVIGDKRKIWSFAGAQNALGWSTSGSGIATDSFDGSGWNLEISSEKETAIISGKLSGVDASKFSKVMVYMHNSHIGNACQDSVVGFKTPGDSNFNLVTAQSYSLGDFYTYEFEMASHTKWQGKINQLVFYPVRCNSGDSFYPADTVSIRAISLIDNRQEWNFGGGKQFWSINSSLTEEQHLIGTGMQYKVTASNPDFTSTNVDINPQEYTHILLAFANENRDIAEAKIFFEEDYGGFQHSTAFITKSGVPAYYTVPIPNTITGDITRIRLRPTFQPNQVDPSKRTVRFDYFKLINGTVDASVSLTKRDKLLQNVEYNLNLKVSNSLVNPITNPRVDLNIPAQLTINENELPTECSFISQILSCNYNDLNEGQQETYVIKVQTSAAVGSNFILSGTLFSNESDYNSSNNQISLSMSVHSGIPQELFQMEKASSPVSHFYSTNEAEIDGEINAGAWQNKKVAFWVHEIDANDAIPVHRFQHLGSVTHLFTTSQSEINKLKNDPNWHYEDDDAFYAFSSPTAGAYPVYRFASTNSPAHYYTINETEKNNLINNDPDWVYERVEFYAFPSENSYLTQDHFGIPDGDSIALIQAMELAKTADWPVTIQLAENGTYQFDTTYGPDVALPAVVSNGLTIDGNGSTLTGIGNTTMRLFGTNNGADVVLKNTVIDGFGSKNTSLTNGGAIYNDGSATMINVTFKNNTAENGGAIYSDGNLTIYDSEFNSNDGLYGGAIRTTSGTLRIYDTELNSNGSNTLGSLGGAIYAEGLTQFLLDSDTFTSNSAETGGAVYTKSNLSVITSSFIANQADIVSSTSDLGKGGAIRSYLADLTITDSSFDNNISSENGGAINVRGSSIISGSSFLSNNGNIGGALYLDGGSIINGQTVFIDNKANSEGGAIKNLGTSNIYGGVIFRFNTARQADGNGNYNGHGGAINTTGPLTLDYVLLQQNNAVNGGAIRSYKTTLNANHVTFADNIGTTGSSIKNKDGYVDIHYSCFEGNTSVSFKHEGTNTLFVKNNWWGIPGGPVAPANDTNLTEDYSGLLNTTGARSEWNTSCPEILH